MINDKEISLEGYNFKISYFDDSISIQKFNPYNRPQTSNYDGLIQVFFLPDELTTETECLQILKKFEDELINEINVIIDLYPNLYNNFEIGKQLYHTIINLFRISGKEYVGQARQVLNLKLKTTTS